MSAIYKKSGQFVVIFLSFQFFGMYANSQYRPIQYLREPTKLINVFYNNMGPLWMHKNATTRKDISGLDGVLYSWKKPRNYFKNIVKKSEKKVKLTKALRLLRRQSKVISSSDRNVLSLPSFDSVNMPNFIYRNPAGEKILNTMLSKQRYRMLEPVPGQVLYPPTVPLFRPKPSLQQYETTTEVGELKNITMIPFYAHEAIDINAANINLLPKVPINDNEADVEAVLTSTQRIFMPKPIGFRTKSVNPLNRRGKQEYTAYHSPDKVHWQPTVPTGDYQKFCTTPFPAVLSDSFKNHRLDMQTTIESTTTPKAHESEDYKQLKNAYMEDSLEKPLRKVVSRPEKLSSRYSVANSNFRVFSLGKLLSTVKTLPEKKLTRPHDSDTWFIINSRYKGRDYNQSDKKHQSKYKLKQSYLNDNFNPKQQFIFGDDDDNDNNNNDDDDDDI